MHGTGELSTGLCVVLLKRKHPRLISRLLRKPLLINRAECTVEQPSLTLEGYPISPLLCIRLQSILGQRIFQQFGKPENISTLVEIRDYVEVLETWMKEFPPEFALENPNTSHETTYPWIALHRHCLHTLAFSMCLSSLRGIMVKELLIEGPALALKLRSNGVFYARRLISAAHQTLEYLWKWNATFHLIPFLIFDTATLLCSVVVHDGTDYMSQRPRIFGAIQLALISLERLSSVTDIAEMPFKILRRMAVMTLPSGWEKQQGHFSE